MSLIIAIKDGDRIVMGADKQCSCGSMKSHTATKVWALQDTEDCIMGGAGYLRVNQIIQYTKGLIDRNAFPNGMNIEEDYIVTTFVDTLRVVLSQYDIVSKIDEEGLMMPTLPNEFIFACKDRAWLISRDMTVEEIEDYVVIGSGGDVAKGVLDVNIDMHPFNRISMAIKVASEETLHVDDYVELMTTVDHEDDEKILNEIYGDALNSENENCTKAD